MIVRILPGRFSQPCTCENTNPRFFFFNDTATTEIYTLSLHDALPIYTNLSKQQQVSEIMRQMLTQAQTAGQYFAHNLGKDRKSGSAGMPRPISYAVFCLKKKRRHLLATDVLATNLVAEMMIAPLRHHL